MKLQGTDGTFFELIIVGYQFPGLADKVYDSNWLQIKINVRHPRGSWSSTDPCLLTYEVESLAHWFEKLGKGEGIEMEEEFMEPHLSFRLHPGPDDVNYLRIYFELAFRPSWAPDAADAEDLWVQFLLSDLNLIDAVSSLREQLARFPQRTVL